MEKKKETKEYKKHMEKMHKEKTIPRTGESYQIIEESKGLTYFENGIFLNKKGEVFTLEDNSFTGQRQLVKQSVETYWVKNK